MMELVNRRSNLASRIHLRQLVLPDLVKVFKLKEMDPGVCVLYQQNINDLLMYRNTPGACRSSVNAMGVKRGLNHVAKKLKIEFDHKGLVDDLYKLCGDLYHAEGIQY